MAIYKRTKVILDNKVIHTNIGVKQGDATNGILFVLYIDRMVKMIKSRCKEDGCVISDVSEGISRKYSFL